MMTFAERIAADIAKGQREQQQNEDQQHQLHAATLRDELARQHPEAPLDERVKGNIGFSRIVRVGERVMERFPELDCFHPQLNKVANAAEFKLFDEFLTIVATNQECREAFQSMVDSKKAEHETQGP
jgi:hypothetical protein